MLMTKVNLLLQNTIGLPICFIEWIDVNILLKVNLFINIYQFSRIVFGSRNQMKDSKSPKSLIQRLYFLIQIIWIYLCYTSNDFFSFQRLTFWRTIALLFFIRCFIKFCKYLEDKVTKTNKNSFTYSSGVSNTGMNYVSKKSVTLKDLMRIKDICRSYRSDHYMLTPSAIHHLGIKINGSTIVLLQYIVKFVPVWNMCYPRNQKDRDKDQELDCFKTSSRKASSLPRNISLFRQRI